MIAVVIKSCGFKGRTLRPGTVVDSTDWRNEGNLLRVRILRPASPSEIAEFNGEPAPRVSSKKKKPELATA